MWFRRLPRQKAGKPITAALLNQTADAAEWATRLRADAPLEIKTTAFGPMLRYAGPIFGAYVAITTTTIGARSGSGPGSGTVKLESWSGSSLSDLPGPTTVTAYSISSTTGGIPSGTYCIVMMIYGAWWIIAVDCGN